MRRRAVVAIAGPTASGKSALAMRLAATLGGEIVNADSVQVYKEFDIGSAKPTAEELRQVNHHLVSVLEPTEQCDAGRFVELADRAIESITGLPLVVGGSGLYLQALLNGLVPIERASVEVKARIAQEFLVGGAERLHQLLAERDPVAAARIHANDVSRSRRALESILGVGVSIQGAKEEHGLGEPRYSALIICLMPPRERLYSTIDRRVEQMFASGLLDETKRIVARYGDSLPGCQAIGYRQCCAHLRGELSFDETVELIKRDTRRFAKRQFTWWRHQPDRLGWSASDVDSVGIVKGQSGGSDFASVAALVREFLAENAEKIAPRVQLRVFEEIHFGLSVD